MQRAACSVLVAAVPCPESQPEVVNKGGHSLDRVAEAGEQGEVVDQQEPALPQPCQHLPVQPLQAAHSRAGTAEGARTGGQIQELLEPLVEDQGPLLPGLEQVEPQLEPHGVIVAETLLQPQQINSLAFLQGPGGSAAGYGAAEQELTLTAEQELTLTAEQELTQTAEKELTPTAEQELTQTAEQN